MNNNTLYELFSEAQKAAGRSYSPYSHRLEGCAVITNKGTIYTGCRVENASYGASVCSEQVAMMKMADAGEYVVEALALAFDEEEVYFPCGLCRQTLMEFAASPEIPLICGNFKGEHEIKVLREILPYAYTAKAHEVHKVMDNKEKGK